MTTWVNTLLGASKKIGWRIRGPRLHAWRHKASADYMGDEQITLDRRMKHQSPTNIPADAMHVLCVNAQITTLVTAWEWSENDVIPLFLPLHHIHGIINILSCGLWAGATVHLFSKFDIPKISEQITLGTYNVFMAVPTIYVKLIQYFETISEDEVEKIKEDA